MQTTRADLTAPTMFPMVPYDRRLLRCDPMLSQLAPGVTREEVDEVSIGSSRRLQWLCSECGAEFKAEVRLMRLSTGRCKKHAKFLKSRARAHYSGDVPKGLLRPIRAGILQGVGVDALSSIVATVMEPVATQAALPVARAYVETIVAGNYTQAQLIDSPFWGEDTVTRADGHRYVRPPRPKRPHRDPDPSPPPPPTDGGDTGSDHRDAGSSGATAAAPHPDYVLIDPPQSIEWKKVNAYDVETTGVPSVLVRECNAYLQQIRYKLLAHWTDYALSFLQVPVPIGDRILCREHALYCYIVLCALYKHYPDVAHGGFLAEMKVLRSVAELLNISQIHPYFLRCILDAIQTIDRAAGLA